MISKGCWRSQCLLINQKVGKLYGDVRAIFYLKKIGIGTGHSLCSSPIKMITETTHFGECPRIEKTTYKFLQGIPVASRMIHKH
jgi:hypothetical protein